MARGCDLRYRRRSRRRPTVDTAGAGDWTTAALLHYACGPAGFDELMPKTIANATVDRLLHHAHVVLTGGDSIRLTQATASKG